MVVTILCVAGCSDNGAQSDRSLSERLPSADDVPLEPLGFDSEASVEQFAGPAGPGLVRPWFYAGRAGSVGYRAYDLTDSSGHDHAKLDLLLYERSSDADARSLWRSEPPEVAHRGAFYFEDRSDEEIEAMVDSLRVPWTSRIDGVDSSAVCLAGPIPYGGPESCDGLHGWVRFCNWVMELEFGGLSRATSEDQLHAFDLLTETTMQRASCRPT